MQEMPQQKSAVEEERNSKVNFPFLVKAVLRSICPVGCFWLSENSIAMEEAVIF